MSLKQINVTSAIKRKQDYSQNKYVKQSYKYIDGTNTDSIIKKNPVEKFHYYKTVAKSRGAGKQLPSLNKTEVSKKSNMKQPSESFSYNYYDYNSHKVSSIDNYSSYDKTTGNDEEYKVSSHHDNTHYNSNHYNSNYESNSGGYYYENKEETEKKKSINNKKKTQSEGNNSAASKISSNQLVTQNQQRRRLPPRSYHSPSKHETQFNYRRIAKNGYYGNNSNYHYQYQQQIKQQRLVAVRPPKTVHHIRAAFSGIGKLKVLCVKPLLIQIDNFIAPSRCKRVVEYANSKLNFTNESADVEHGDRRARTSSGCWLSEEPQINHPDIKYINESLANLVGFPEENCEPLHVVKYAGGQEYWPHNDFIEKHKYMSCGGRIATMLVYLTDCADGGATNFPLLDITIYPKPGTVVLWYNVLPTSDGSHVIVDQRMLHSGMPVGPAGEKMIMCKWVHPYKWVY